MSLDYHTTASHHLTRTLLPASMKWAAKSEVALVVDRWLAEEGREQLIECLRMSEDPDVCRRELASLFVEVRKYWEQRRDEQRGL